jgi:hypothetical protein
MQEKKFIYSKLGQREPEPVTYARASLEVVYGNLNRFPCF